MSHEGRDPDQIFRDVFPKWENARDGVKRAVRTAVARYISGDHFTSGLIATRYGKSDWARLTTLFLVWTDLAPVGIVIEPSVKLRDQIIDRRKVDAMIARYGITRNIRARVVNRFTMPLNPNGEELLSITVQLAMNCLNELCLWVEHVLRTTGKRPVFFFDEGHSETYENDWGKVATELERAGAYVVVMTATAIRHDKKIPVGFRAELVETKTGKEYHVSAGSSPEMVLVKKYDFKADLYELTADVTVTFEQAYDEDALCKIDWTPVDIELQRIAGLEAEPEQRLLSTLGDATEIRYVLARAVRDQYVMQRLLIQFVRTLDNTRERDRYAGGIVFTASDEAGASGSDKQAKAAERILKRIAPQYRVVIATTSDGSEGNDDLKRFEQGDGDIVIVKQLGGLGWDCERLKVGVDLSPERAFGRLVQRMMRIATLYSDFKVAVWITLADRIGQDIFDTFVAMSGGKGEARSLTFEKEYQVPRKEDERPLYVIDDTTAAAWADTDGRTAEVSEHPRVAAFLSYAPDGQAIWTKAHIADFTAGWVIPGMEQATATLSDLGIEVDALRADINGLAATILGRRLKRSGEPYDRDAWGRANGELFSEAYRGCGVIERHLKDIVSIATLQRIKKWFAIREQQESRA